jgi:hypothetical protein
MSSPAALEVCPYNESRRLKRNGGGVAAVTDWRKVITVLMGAAAVCAISHADMMPLCPAETGLRPPSLASTPADPCPTRLSIAWAPFTDIVSLGTSPIGFLSLPDPERAHIGETRPAQVLTDGQSSLTLCLYALLGLGICRSAPFVKRFQLSCVVDWYHSGGPFPIGHSFVISPDCVPLTPFFCFIQREPTAATGGLLPHFSQGIVVSLWRQCQFAPITLAPRGPPSLS